ncbi:MAG: glycoside hydrolase 15 protein [Alyxoria varia]|nr:MAG: glycoside hydrolase 15 protein [Alyxoria varia]
MLLDKIVAAGSVVALWFFTRSSTPSCKTYTLAKGPPDTGRGVALHTYSFCGGTLNISAYVENTNYNKLVTLFYLNALSKSTPRTCLPLRYSSPPSPPSTYELWATSNHEIYIEGISTLTNLTYTDLDADRTYVQNLSGIKVIPSGATPPEVDNKVPKPYATPTGFSADIDELLDAERPVSQARKAKGFLLRNVNVEGAAEGTVIAAQSWKEPDYAYNWVRDASLTMEPVVALYTAVSNKTTVKTRYADILFQYARARSYEQTAPDLRTSLGEPKFYLDNSVYTGPWGRPQNDGPATSAIYLMQFGNAYLDANNGNVTAREEVRQKLWDGAEAPMKKDLRYVAENWAKQSFDIWEEVYGHHFYNGMVQRRALREGAQFARRLGDDEGGVAEGFERIAGEIEDSLEEFWEGNRGLMLYEWGLVKRGKSSYEDVAVVLGVLHGYADDGVFGPTDERVLATAVRVATGFLDVFPIAGRHEDEKGNVLGIPVGRYPEDTYDGLETSGLGNPWYLTTLALAELLYRCTSSLTTARSLTVTHISLPFFQYFTPAANVSANATYTSDSPEFEHVVEGLKGWGDAFVRTVGFYGGSGEEEGEGHLSEEFDRRTGIPTGARDLTWSYGAVLTAGMERVRVIGGVKGVGRWLRILGEG